MLTNDIKYSIETSVLGWLATVNENGQPSVSPKEAFVAYGDHSVLVAHIASPNSVRNIKLNPKVCFSFVDVFRQKGYQLYGDAFIILKNDDDFGSYSSALRDIIGDDFPIQAVIKIDIESFKPIIAPSYRLFPDRSETDQIASAKQTYDALYNRLNSEASHDT